MIVVRNAYPKEFLQIGSMLVDVYSSLDGFPKPKDQPAYYEMLSNVGELCSKPGAEILVAVDAVNEISGAVVYFGDMKYYGSGGTATQEPNASGFRLLAVTRKTRGLGIGKILTQECIRKAKLASRTCVVIHTTMAMGSAWHMYEKIGFKRQPDLDFVQEDLPVFGFRYFLKETFL